MSPLIGFTCLLACQLLGEAIAHWARLPFPGAVLGLLLLLPLLAWQRVREPVAQAAGFLLSHLSLLFIPAGVGVLAHLELLQAYGGRLALILIVSTWIGMIVTVLALRAGKEPDDA
ncbi:CidA/LrgA family protein [Verticiella sediminum]|uniref:CidA/LrgA family protein n=1 Tax=Verticiella sediminum TaxID=1247510 RepID=A0A556AYY7_9BURK|nr:CidA/LrgA family protein [Verticiella sediminum]TSH97655.1 CidA/LrgA family protein [Verticiella sediminum]